MNKNYRIVIGIVLLFTNGFAQDVAFKSSNFKDKKEEFKVALTHFEKGEEFLVLGNEAIYNVQNPGDNFKAALLSFEKAYAFNPNSAQLNFYIGNAYLYTNEKYKADDYLQVALKLNPEVDDFLNFYLGMTAQLNMKFDDAIQYYKAFEATSKSKQIASLGRMLTKRIKECKYGKTISAKEERVWIDNIKNINSENDEYGPCISTDGATIVFTSDRDNGHDPNSVGEFDGDIYITDLDEKGNWSKPKSVGSPLNTPYDETSSMLSYDGTKMLLYKKESDNYDVYESVLVGANWSSAAPLHRSLNTIANQTYASYYPGNRKMYFISDKKVGSTIKGTEVYFCGKMNNSDTKFGEAQSAGIVVNTKFNEGPMYIHPKGDIMYFCSEGHNSMGGFDIFMSRKKQGQWTEPVNMGYPINTPYDDYFFAVTASNKYAYIASNRAGGVGGLDIYKVTFWGPPKEFVSTTQDYLLASVANPIQDVQIESKVKVDKTALTVFKGITKDALTDKPVEAQIEITDNATGKIIETFTTNSVTGKFLLSLVAGKNYGIAVKAPDYLFHSENFDILEPKGFNMVNKIIRLKNIKKGNTIALRNIFFDTGKSTLKEASNSELDRLVKLMTEAVSITVEISGHTDNIGSESLNAKLSQDRADAVVNYLVNHGVSKARLESQGYGASKPVASNATADGRQQNRRTEFKILEN